MRLGSASRISAATPAACGAAAEVPMNIFPPDQIHISMKLVLLISTQMERIQVNTNPGRQVLGLPIP